jgi:hypothetical protein
MKKSIVLLGAVLGLLALQAGATVTTGVPWTGTLPMPVVNYFGPGPQSFANYTWTSTNATHQGGSVFGYTGGYGFGGNGFWNGRLGPMAGLNDSFDVYGVTDTMTFAFTTPVDEVGGFFNYVPFGSTLTTLAVYDASFNLIESYNLTFVTGTGVNLGEWIEFSETTPISFFTMTGNYVGVANPIPEPGSLLLLGSGLLGVAGMIRRKLMM